MEQLPLSFVELLQMVAYFSSLSILVGVILQVLFLFLGNQKLSAIMLAIVIVTQLLAFAATLILWLKWPSGLRILYGPILFPAVIAQIIFVPLVPGFFGFRIGKSKKVKS